jgi:hypothetical protein
MQPIRMPRDNRAEATGAKICKEGLIPGSAPSSKRRHIIVDVDSAEHPTEPIDQPLAV